MRNRPICSSPPQDAPPRTAVIRRRDRPEPRHGAVEQKLQADVAAWLKERRSAR